MVSLTLILEVSINEWGLIYIRRNSEQEKGITQMQRMAWGDQQITCQTINCNWKNQ